MDNETSLWISPWINRWQQAGDGDLRKPKLPTVAVEEARCQLREAQPSALPARLGLAIPARLGSARLSLPWPRGVARRRRSVPEGGGRDPRVPTSS